jgi:hypothetical protein
VAVERVGAFETPPIEGHVTNGVTGYPLTVYLATPTVIPSPPEFVVEVFVGLWMTFTNSGGAQFLPGVIAPITVHVVPWPVADAQQVTTAEDTAIGIVLTGWDQEALPLTYAIVQGPGAGTLAGTPPNLTYTPNTNFCGTDRFLHLLDRE